MDRSFLASSAHPSADACAGCTGACCENVLVPITGYDAWRIAGANSLPLDAFSTVASTVPGSRGGFRLDVQWVALVLRRKSAFAAACYFLRESAGARRCTTHPSRPHVCRSYPMRLADDGAVVLRSDVTCRTGDWDLETLSYDLWRRNLAQDAFEADLHDRVLAVWNASSFDGLEVFGRFILDAFDAIDAYLRSAEAAACAVPERLDRVSRLAEKRLGAKRSDL